MSVVAFAGIRDDTARSWTSTQSFTAEQLAVVAAVLRLSSSCTHHQSGAREPWGQEGQMTPRNLPGGETWYFDPQIFVERNILWYTHTLLWRLHRNYIIFWNYRSRSVFLLSFITHLWTRRNVALVTLTPSQRIVRARLRWVDAREVMGVCHDIQSTYRWAERNGAGEIACREHDWQQRCRYCG